MKKTYVIRYTLYGLDGSELKSGTIKAKRMDNGVEAQVKLERFLKKRHPFCRLVVHDCREDENPLSFIFDNL